jgi:mono/diheme cytochrome c family protein
MSNRRLVLSFLLLTSIATIIYSCQGSGNMQQDMYYTNGRDLYIKKCQNCHGANGEGLAALAPPLTDSVYLKANRSKLVCIIRKGLVGHVLVNGKDYEGKMPDFPEIADIDLAQLIVYITNTWGNNQGMYTTTQVASDLKNCK